MPTYGLKISKSGYDVKIATDDQLAFSSQFNYLKIGVSGTTDITLSGTSGTTDITHNMNYKPARLSFARRTSLAQDYYFPEAMSSAGLAPKLAAKADTTKLYFRITGSSGEVYRIGYFVFRNPVDDTATGGTVSGNYGLKVARLGYSVSAAPEKMAFHSGIPMLKLKTEGTDTIVNPNSQSSWPQITEHTIAHNLGYYPCFLVFSYYPAYDTTPRRCPNPHDDLLTSYAQATTSNLTLGVWASHYPEVTVKFRYFIFVDRIE